MRLQSKVAVVTGGASGMGRAGALGMAREGAQVAILDQNERAGAETVAEIQEAGGEALFIHADLTRAVSCEAAFAQAEARFGKIDTAFFSAAVQMFGHDTIAHEVSEDTFDRTIAINLKGLWLSCKYVLPAMMRAGGGSLILAGSPTGLNGASGYTAYATSKAGAFSLARTIALDYAKHKIRANVLVPGPTNTPLTREIFADPAFRDAIERATILGRVGEAHEIVGLLVFLASNESSYCTGGYFMADGGMTAM